MAPPKDNSNLNATTTTSSDPPTTAMATPKTILVASTNPVKIRAAERAFARMFPGVTHTARGLSVPSGVPDQPFSDATTLLGARNRAEGARAADPEGADYWVGIEGGVDDDPQDGELLRSFAWVVVLDREEKTKMGRARTATYYLPRETAELVRGGMELGRADEVVFGRVNSKQKNGSVGLLTGDVIDRGGYYEEAVVLALIPFRNRGLTF